jgi:hypothetical protein
LLKNKITQVTQMKRGLSVFLLYFILFISASCTKKGKEIVPVIDGGINSSTQLVNTSHLENLTVPVTFPNGMAAEAVYIYSNAPNYSFANADGEGFTCVDDVARAVLFYIRSSEFSSDPATQTRTFNLIRFLINMQADNGYFYNFLQTGNVINKTGSTSAKGPNWWAWRALQALAEAAPVIKTKDIQLSNQIDAAVNKLIANIKTDLVNIPKTTANQNGITVPEWLPGGSDTGAILILGLISYCKSSGDADIKEYIRKLADGLVLTQQGDAAHFPYSCFLSSGNLWHGWGSDQAHALFQAGLFLNDTNYTSKALAEVDNFYPWLLQNGFKYSFEIENVNNTLIPKNVKNYEQIAYAIRPVVFAAIDAYEITKNEKYADLAGRLAAWFLGNNAAGTAMYSPNTGRCFDGINAGNVINYNSGAESTIEALLTMQRVSSFPTIKAALMLHK